MEAALDGYTGLLEDNCFQYYSYTIENGSVITYYANAAYNTILAFGDVDLNGTECIRVQIMGM